MASRTPDPPQWDPISLTYSSEGREVELPLRLLLMGEFSTRKMPDSGGEPKPVTPATLDAVIEEIAPVLELSLPDCLLDGEDTRELQVPLRCMDDFKPGRIVANVPELNRVLEVTEHLRAGQVAQIAKGDTYLEGLLAELGWDDRGIDRSWIDYAVAELNDRLRRQIDEVLHHSEFQRLEANWRSVDLVLQQCEEGACRVDLLDISVPELAENFKSAVRLDDSLLYSILHAREFGQYGGEPYAAVIASYELGASAEDVALLRSISRVSAWAHAPFLAGASPALFGLERFDELVEATSLHELRRSPSLAKWWSLSSEESSRYVGLTAPRVLLRAPYDGYDEESGFVYHESIVSSRRHCLWGVAAFALAECMVRSFLHYRVCFDITGPGGGRVESVPAQWPRRDGQGPAHGVETVFPEAREAELTELGFIPVSIARAHDFIAFNSARSIHSAEELVKVTRDDRDDLGLRLGAQLPYLFLVSRVAHYLKVIQRDMIGSSKSEAEMQSELDSWLRRYVSDVDSPSAEIRARRPLRAANLSVTDEAGDGSAYRMHLELVPHTRYLNSEYSLSVEGRLGRA